MNSIMKIANYLNSMHPYPDNTKMCYISNKNNFLSVTLDIKISNQITKMNTKSLIRKNKQRNIQCETSKLYAESIPFGTGDRETDFECAKLWEFLRSETEESSSPLREA